MQIARDATHEDIPRMLELGHMMHGESRYARFPMQDEKVSGLFRGLIDAPSGIVLVTEHGMLVGVVAEYWFGKGLYSADYLIFVSPEHRGNGESVTLMRTYIDKAKELGAQDIHVEASTAVDVDKTDQFFKRLGFNYCGGNFVMEVA